MLLYHYTVIRPLVLLPGPHEKPSTGRRSRTSNSLRADTAFGAPLRLRRVLLVLVRTESIATIRATVGKVVGVVVVLWGFRLGSWDRVWDGDCCAISLFRLSFTITFMAASGNGVPAASFRLICLSWTYLYVVV